MQHRVNQQVYESGLSIQRVPGVTARDLLGFGDSIPASKSGVRIEGLLELQHHLGRKADALREWRRCVSAIGPVAI